MNKFLSESDRTYLNQLIAETERRIDAQVVLSVVRRSDTYAEIPWKAFALGTAVAGMISFALNLFWPVWNSPFQLLISLLVPFAFGIMLALLTVFVPLFAGLFLTSHRAGEEVRQYAESAFLSHEIYATSKHTGILILVSLFERRVFLLPDKGLDNLLHQEEVQSIIDPMTDLLRQNEIRKAFEEGLKQLTYMIERSGPRDSVSRNENELSDNIIEEEGV
jgi:putative membrane protein